ncbi:MAG: DUF4313 domain-containing protein [Firmicutes bacterium]|nr:DUF4313 domain-containing protein [Bacillota bacterium]
MNKEKKLEISEDRILTYHLDGIADKKVWLCISWYEDNGSICVMLNTEYAGEEIEYCILTVNIVPSLPPYYAYLDTNNIPCAEQFVRDNKLGAFTGIMGNSGYCSYPLYQFDKDRLYELAAEDMAIYEENIKK